MKFPVVKTTSLLFITLFLALFFAFIYWKFFGVQAMDSLYKSVSIQTIGGDSIKVKTDGEKFIVILQQLLAYMIVSGLIVVSLNK
jgi:hypothetical protein